MAVADAGQKETARDWRIAVWCTVITFFHAGLQRTGTLLFVECMARYNVNREKASIPFTVSYLALFLSGPFIGYLGNHFQLRTIITFGTAIGAIGVFGNFWAENIVSVTICWGILFGLGAGAAAALLVEILNRHFDKHLATVCGLYFAGGSIGATIIPYLSKVLLDHYGLSGAFLILGGLTLNTVPAAMALPVYPRVANPSIPNKNDQNVEDKSNDTPLKELDSDGKAIYSIHHNAHVVEVKIETLDTPSAFGRNSYTVNEKLKTEKKPRNPKPSVLSTFSIFLNPTFLAIGFMNSFFLGVVATLNIMLVDYCLEQGITSDQGVYIVMAVSLTDVTGRLGLGWVTDCGFMKAVNLLWGSFVMLGFSCLLYVWSHGFAMCMVSSVIYGTLYGVIAAFSPKMIKDYIEPKVRTMAVASRRVFFSPIAIALPSILGYFKDKVKSYDGLMYALATISFISAVLTSIVPYLAKREQKSPKPTASNEQRF